MVPGTASLVSSVGMTGDTWRWNMTSEGSKQIDWTAYAQVYDLMAENNPAYQEILLRCLETIAHWNLPPGSRIIDLGAGTGNFSVRIAQALPQCRILHVDANTGRK